METAPSSCGAEANVSGIQDVAGVQEGKLCFVRANQQVNIAAVAFPLVAEHAQSQDLLVVNFGLHRTKDYAAELQQVLAESSRCMLTCAHTDCPTCTP